MRWNALASSLVRRFKEKREICKASIKAITQPYNVSAIWCKDASDDSESYTDILSNEGVPILTFQNRSPDAEH